MVLCPLNRPPLQKMAYAEAFICLVGPPYIPTTLSGSHYNRTAEDLLFVVREPIPPLPRSGAADSQSMI